MPYRQDTTTISLLWGRIGAAVLLLIATVLQGFGYTFDLPAQEAVFDAVSAVLGGVALILVVISKVRESKKLNEPDLES